MILTYKLIVLITLGIIPRRLRRIEKIPGYLVRGRRGSLFSLLEAFFLICYGINFENVKRGI